MVLRKPMVRLVGDDKTPVLQKFEERYTEDELVLDYLYTNDDAEEESDDENVAESIDAGSDMSWLDALN